MAGIRTVCIPSSDTVFSDIVNRTLALSDSISEPTQLEDALRDAYPEIRVRPRELVGEVAKIWYVYRNGMGFAAPGAER